MKLQRILLLVSLAGVSFSQAYHVSSGKKSKFHPKNHLSVMVKNETGVALEEVAATFRFVNKEDTTKSIKSTMKYTDLASSTGFSFNSNDALYEGQKAKDHFKSSYVELVKISAGRWKIKNFKIRSARIKFKDGTFKNDFVIRVVKNRFGVPMYAIQPTAREDISAAE